MDVPRQVFNVSFYTEQLLTVCLGLTLALAFVVETQREYRADRPRRARSPSLIILVYIAYRFPNPLDIPPLLWLGLALALVWTLLGEPAARSRAAFDCASAAVSLAAVRLHLRALRAADLRARDAADRRHRRQRDPDLPGAGGEPPHARASASSPSSWRWRSTSTSARTCRAISRPAGSRRSGSSPTSASTSTASSARSCRSRCWW